MVLVLLRLLNFIFMLYEFAIIARSLLPWFRVGPYHPVMQFLIRITEPVLGPLRRHIPPVGGLDFTPMVALILLWAVERVIRTLLVSLY